MNFKIDLHSLVIDKTEDDIRGALILWLGKIDEGPGNADPHQEKVDAIALALCNTNLIYRRWTSARCSNCPNSR